jgi:hypothetical protein
MILFQQQLNAYKSFYKEIDLYVKSNICNDNLFFFIRPRIEYSKEGVIYSYFHMELILVCLILMIQ